MAEEIQIPYQTAKLLEALDNEKTQTPPAARRALKTFAERSAAIKAQQFQRPKEAAQLAELRTLTGNELAAHIRREEEAAVADRDQELKAVDVEIARAQELPNRQSGELEGEYTAKLQKRAILETRELRAAVQANSDLLLIAQVNDPIEIERITSEAIESGNPAHIARVARAAEHKLSRLAIAEARNKELAATRPAVEASARMANQLRQWRATESEKSPQVKRQRIIARYERRVNDARLVITRVANAFELSDVLAAGLRGK